MKQQISRVSVLKSSFSLAVVGHFITLALLVFLYIFAHVTDRLYYQTIQFQQFITVPFIASFLIFVQVVVGASIYNQLAKFGVAIELHIKNVNIA